MVDTDRRAGLHRRLGTNDESAQNPLGHNARVCEQAAILLGQQRRIGALCTDQRTSEAFQFSVTRFERWLKLAGRSVLDDVVIGNLVLD